MAADPIAEATRPYPGPGASPDVIAASLRPEDREPFRRAYRAALAADDADGLRTVVDRWRGIALMQSDPERYAAVVRRIAARNTGRPVPPDEPFADTRHAAGM